MASPFLRGTGGGSIPGGPEEGLLSQVAESLPKIRFENNESVQEKEF